MRKRLVAAALTATLALAFAPAARARGASQDQKVYGEARPTEALIYVVRLGEFAGSGRTEKLFLEEKCVAVLPNNSYTFTYVPPGSHLFWGSFHKDAVFLDLTAGQTYYLVFKLSQLIALVTEPEGKAALEKVGRYRTISDSDRVKGAAEGLEKWPRYKEKYADRLALSASEEKYEPPASTEGLLRLPAQTSIQVELMEHLSSGAVKVGDAVWVQVYEDVVVADGVVVRKGAPVRAVVRDVKGAGGFGREGKMDLALLSVTAVDGTKCPLTGQVAGRGQTRSTTAAGLLAGVAGSYLVRGDQNYRPAGTTAMVYTSQDVWVKPASGMTAAASTPGEPPAAGTLRAWVTEPVACDFPNGKGPKSIDVLLDAPDDIASALVTQVGGNTLPAPVAATQVARSKKGLAASFEGWAVCRYLKVPPRIPPKPPATPSAKPDAPTLVTPGETTVTLRVDRKDGSVAETQVSVRVGG